MQGKTRSRKKVNKLPRQTNPFSSGNSCAASSQQFVAVASMVFNKLFVADKQQRKAAARRMLPAVQRQRYAA